MMRIDLRIKKTKSKLKKVLLSLIPRKKDYQFLIAPSPKLNLDLKISDKYNSDSSSKPVIISYGTRDGVYDKFVNRLQNSCTKNNMECDIETIPSCNYANATLFKPTFIKFKLLTLNCPLLWLDADTVMVDGFELPSTGWDIATLNNNLSHPVNEKASLCIGLQPTIATLRFLETWEQLCAAHWQPGTDHIRFSYTRRILSDRFREIDITPHVTGKIVRDVGTRKEANI